MDGRYQVHYLPHFAVDNEAATGWLIPYPMQKEPSFKVFGCVSQRWGPYLQSCHWGFKMGKIVQRGPNLFLKPFGFPMN